MEAKDVGVGNCQECGAELSAPGLSRRLAHSVPLQKTIGEVSSWTTLRHRPPKIRIAAPASCRGRTLALALLPWDS